MIGVRGWRRSRMPRRRPQHCRSYRTIRLRRSWPGHGSPPRCCPVPLPNPAIVHPLPTVAASSLLRSIISVDAVGVGEGDLRRAGEGEGFGRGAATAEVREGQGPREAEQVHGRRHRRGDRGGGGSGAGRRRRQGCGARPLHERRKIWRSPGAANSVRQWYGPSNCNRTVQINFTILDIPGARRAVHKWHIEKCLDLLRRIESWQIYYSFLILLSLYDQNRRPERANILKTSMVELGPYPEFNSTCLFSKC